MLFFILKKKLYFQILNVTAHALFAHARWRQRKQPLGHLKSSAAKCFSDQGKWDAILKI